MELTCYRCEKNGFSQNDSLGVQPVANEYKASAAFALNSPIYDSCFAWSVGNTDLSGLSGDCFYFNSYYILHICKHFSSFTDLHPNMVKVLVKDDAAVDNKGI